MKVDVVVEMVCGVIEDVKVFLSETTAQKHIRKWFKKHYPCQEAPSFEGNYHAWKAGDFEFGDNEIYQSDTSVLGPTGQDICKGCRGKVIE